MKYFLSTILMAISISFSGCAVTSPQEQTNTLKNEQRVFMTGMYSYMADSAIFTECITGIKYPVAFKEDSISLERAYLKQSKGSGESLKVYIDAQIQERNMIDKKGKEASIVVKKFIRIIPNKNCEKSKPKASLTNTYWKLTTVDGKEVQSTGKREAHMILNNGKIQGSTGCNGLGGSYTLDGDKISFSDKGMMSTMMFCKGSPEKEFRFALKNMSSYRIKGEHLEIYNKHHTLLAVFESIK